MCLCPPTLRNPSVSMLATRTLQRVIPDSGMPGLGCSPSMGFHTDYLCTHGGLFYSTDTPKVRPSTPMPQEPEALVHGHGFSQRIS